MSVSQLFQPNSYELHANKLTVGTLVAETVETPEEINLKKEK